MLWVRQRSDETASAASFRRRMRSCCPAAASIPLPPATFDFIAVDDSKEILGAGVAPGMTGDAVPRLVVVWCAPARLALDPDPAKHESQDRDRRLRRVIALAAVVRFRGLRSPFLASSNCKQQLGASLARVSTCDGRTGHRAAGDTDSCRKSQEDRRQRRPVRSCVENHVQSPTIDKLAASEALLACAEFRPRRKREPEEQAAAQELAVRCAGIRQNMRRNDAIDKAVELRASAEDDPSPLGRLVALARRSDAGKARWHAAEFALVGEALRSGDSVLISEAIRALHAQLDDGLPDSKLRSQAFAQAADSYVLHKGDQRTVFDALVDCANLGRCANDSGRARSTTRGWRHTPAI